MYVNVVAKNVEGHVNVDTSSSQQKRELLSLTFLHIHYGTSPMFLQSNPHFFCPPCVKCRLYRTYTRG